MKKNKNKYLVAGKNLLIGIAFVLAYDAALAKENISGSAKASVNSRGSASYENKLQSIITSKDAAPIRLDRLFKMHWQNLMETYPEWATYVGYPGQNANWTDYSLEAIEKQKKIPALVIDAIRSIDRKKVRKDQQISYDLLLREMQDSVEGKRFPGEFLPIDQMGGIQVDIAEIIMAMPKSKISDFEDRIQRLKKSPKLIKEVQILLQEGLRRGITQPKIVLEAVPKQFEDILKTNPEESPLFQSFLEIDKQISPDDQKKIRDRALAVIKEKLYPALTELQKYFTQSYLPNCRTTVGLASLPDGAAWYAFKAKKHTTVNMSPDEIHQLGLSEVARIRQAMEKIKDDLHFSGDLKKFNEFLKTDSQFYYSDSKDLMMGFRDVAKRIDPELPKLFGKLPRLPYGVREIAAYKAPSAPTAYYMNGSSETGKAGYFETNTFNLKARPKWQMEVLTLHEAVPGHHLQISLAQEITGLPDFRKNSGPTAFVEGWGLYSESLGEELGLYKDVYSKYGQLTFEIWRAIRLVVDTGLHSKGWTREQVIEYFKDNSPISEQQIMNETDRYIADAGQALAYKIGELKFKALRREAQEKLGERFSIREFHDELLNAGALPLSLVENKIHDWIKIKSMKK